MKKHKTRIIENKKEDYFELMSINKAIIYKCEDIDWAMNSMSEAQAETVCLNKERG